MKKVFTLLLATVLFSSVAWADYSVTAYKGNSTPDTMVLTSTADWQAVLDVTPNAVAIIDGSIDGNADFAATTKNIIVMTTKKISVGATTITKKSYNCPNLQLTDLSKWGSFNATTAGATDFYTPVDFYAAAGSYTRNFRSDLNSMCVPFEIKQLTDFDTEEILTYTSYNQEDNNAVFEPAKSNISAGVAVIVRPATAGDKTFTFNNTLIVANPVTNNLVGTFVTTDQYAGSYSVNNQLEGKFSPLAGNLYPFRCCFTLTTGTSGGGKVETAPRMVILENSETTGLEEMNANAEDVKFFQNDWLMIRHNGQVFDAAGKVVK